MLTTLSTVLGDYLREYQAKLRAEASRLERAGAAADLKRADAHRRALTECEDYERDVLYPLVTQGVDINLDDGVLVNYLRFGSALQKVWGGGCFSGGGGFSFSFDSIGWSRVKGEVF
ncbi:hypothetical protein [Actinomyces trachealis]|uniref:hypothetical protein n=1 Tax=Actinomyces trachealis TaxID=2763540 RepID=UPI001892CF59|nr:hypothetical protein [Actinomyces trachealis]